MFRSHAGRFGDRPRRAVLCRSFDQVGVLGDLAPAIFERSQIFDAVALHRLEQSLEPLPLVAWSADATVRIGISSFMVRRTAAPRALDEVSIPWNAGQMRSINDTTPSPAATRSDFATDLISAAALRWASCGFASLLRPSFWRSRRSAGCGAGAAEAPMEVDARLFWRQTSRAASTTANSSWGYAFGDELKTRGALEAAVAHDATKSPVRRLLWQSIPDPSRAEPLRSALTF